MTLYQEFYFEGRELNSNTFPANREWSQIHSAGKTLAMYHLKEKSFKWTCLSEHRSFKITTSWTGLLPRKATWMGYTNCMLSSRYRIVRHKAPSSSQFQTILGQPRWVSCIGWCNKSRNENSVVYQSKNYNYISEKGNYYK